MFTGHATAYYKEDAMVSKDKFMFDFEKVIFKLIQQSDFDNHDVLPLLLLGSSEGSSNSVEMANNFLKTLTIDFDDEELSRQIYKLIFGDFDLFFHLNE